MYAISGETCSTISGKSAATTHSQSEVVLYACDKKFCMFYTHYKFDLLQVSLAKDKARSEMVKVNSILSH